MGDMGTLEEGPNGMDNTRAHLRGNRSSRRPAVAYSISGSQRHSSRRQHFPTTDVYLSVAQDHIRICRLRRELGVLVVDSCCTLQSPMCPCFFCLNSPVGIETKGVKTEVDAIQTETKKAQG